MLVFRIITKGDDKVMSPSFLVFLNLKENNYKIIFDNTGWPAKTYC